MKTTIKSIALLLAAALPAVAIAEALGADLPRSFNLENSIGAFTLAFFALITLADYSRRSPKLVTAAAVAAPQPSDSCAACEPHRLAA